MYALNLSMKTSAVTCNAHINIFGAANWVWAFCYIGLTNVLTGWTHSSLGTLSIII